MASGVPAFDPVAIRALRDGVRPPDRCFDITDDGRLVPHSAGRLSIWAQRDEHGLLVLPPLPGHRYVVGADTAMGEGGLLGRVNAGEGREDDRSWAAAEVFDVDTLEQVAEWHSPSDGPHFETELRLLCTQVFPEPLLCIELNLLGGYVQTRLMEVYGYTNFHPWRGRQDQIRPTPEKLYGWVMNTYSRGLALGTAQTRINFRQVAIRSEALLTQLESFSRVRGGMFECSTKDDLAIAAMLAWRSAEESYGAGIGTPGAFGGHRRLPPGLPFPTDTAAEDLVGQELRRAFRGRLPW